MDREDLVTAALAAGGHRVKYLPVHVQKLFFLIDWELASHVGGPHFRFKPFHYGPFDRQVYRVLDSLAEVGILNVIKRSDLPIYRLSSYGQEKGEAILATQIPMVAVSLTECAEWVRMQSFQSLLTEIYARYPKMAAKSKTPELVQRARQRRQNHPNARAFARGLGSLLDLSPNRPASIQDDVQDVLAGDWQAIGDDLRNVVVPFPRFPKL